MIDPRAADVSDGESSAQSSSDSQVIAERSPGSADREGISLTEAKLTRPAARALRARLEHFAEDWDDPAMDVYDAL